MQIQCRIQDFLREGAPTLQGAPTYDFAKFSQKLHEIERILTPERTRVSCYAPPIRSATEIHFMLVASTFLGTAGLDRTSVMLWDD